MHRLRVILTMLLVAGLLGFAPGAQAKTDSAKTASIVVDAESGAVLHADHAGLLWHPASLTKIMTAYLVFEALRNGTLTLAQKLTVSKRAAAQPASRVGLRHGWKITVEDTLRAMVVASGNDAAVVLAEALAGDEASFARKMTATARRLGMGRTRFVNASGLPAETQVTTARDMALLARALIRDFPSRYPFFRAREVSVRGKRRSTTNGWLTSYQGADGIKTGFTCASGYNLVGSANRNGRRLIAVLLGGKTSGARNSRMTKLLNAAFKKAEKGPNGTPFLNLEEMRNGAKGTPPRVLSWKECTYGTAGKAKEAKLTGWGVIFGSYKSRDQARSVIDTNRAILKPVVRRGRAAVVERLRDGTRPFSALIVGLKQEDAGKACKYLWQVKAYCLTLPPAQLTNPQAIWR